MYRSELTETTSRHNAQTQPPPKKTKSTPPPKTTPGQGPPPRLDRRPRRLPGGGRGALPPLALHHPAVHQHPVRGGGFVVFVFGFFVVVMVVAWWCFVGWCGVVHQYPVRGPFVFCLWVFCGGGGGGGVVVVFCWLVWSSISASGALCGGAGLLVGLEWGRSVGAWCGCRCGLDTDTHTHTHTHTYQNINPPKPTACWRSSPPGATSTSRRPSARWRCCTRPARSAPAAPWPHSRYV